MSDELKQWLGDAKAILKTLREDVTRDVLATFDEVRDLANEAHRVIGLCVIISGVNIVMTLAVIGYLILEAMQ